MASREASSMTGFDEMNWLTMTLCIDAETLGPGREDSSSGKVVVEGEEASVE